MSRRRKKSRGNPASSPRPARRTPPPPAPDENSNPRILVYVATGICLFMGLYLHAYAMPQLTYFAEGQLMPSARPWGYSLEDIEALRGALEDDAAGQLNFLHKTAGIIFPISLILASWATMGLLVRGTWRWAVVAAAALFAVVDIWENVMIDRILAGDSPTQEAVATASSLTTISWVLLILVGAVVLGTIVTDAIRTRTSTHDDAG